MREQIPLTGASDHYVSEALYLRDPDRHGIEIYADRPRELWEGRVHERMTTEPLDVDDLLRELDDPAIEPFDGLPTGTGMGHVHLQVAEIPHTIRFYRDLLGFDLVAGWGEAAFLSAGGYHHHLGANTWQSAGASPPPPGSAALRHATIVLPDASERDRVASRVADAGQEPVETEAGLLVGDPSGNALVLAV
jgi:catechol 2,3-dioxygenase